MGMERIVMGVIFLGSQNGYIRDTVRAREQRLAAEGSPLDLRGGPSFEFWYRSYGLAVIWILAIMGDFELRGFRG